MIQLQQLVIPFSFFDGSEAPWTFNSHEISLKRAKKKVIKPSNHVDNAIPSATLLNL